MRLESHSNTHPRLLRTTALADEPALSARAPKKPGQQQVPVKDAKQSESTRVKSESPSPGKGGRKPGGSRFLGPTHLDDARKARICKALEERKVGDPMGREIFVGAVEYQLSAFADQLVTKDGPRNAPPPRDTALEKTRQGIVEEARRLSILLRELPEESKADLTRALTAQDERGRSYDARYLCELGCEIDRLERACAGVSVGAAPDHGSDPQPSREFVRKLGEVFSACFEQEPTAAEDGPFRACLLVLEQHTDLVIGHDPAFLEAAIADGPA